MAHFSLKSHFCCNNRLYQFLWDVLGFSSFIQDAYSMRGGLKWSCQLKWYSLQGLNYGQTYIVVYVSTQSRGGPRHGIVWRIGLALLNVHPTESYSSYNKQEKIVVYWLLCIGYCVLCCVM